MLKTKYRYSRTIHDVGAGLPLIKQNRATSMLNFGRLNDHGFQKPVKMRPHGKNASQRLRRVSRDAARVPKLLLLAEREAQRTADCPYRPIDPVYWALIAGARSRDVATKPSVKPQ